MSKITGLEVDYVKIRNKGYLSFDETTNELTLSHVNTLSSFVGFEIKNITSSPDFFEVFNLSTNYVMTVEFDFNLGSNSTVTATKGDASISSIVKSNNIMVFNYQAPSSGDDKLVFHLYSNDNNNDTYLSWDTKFHDTSKPIGTYAARFTYGNSYLTLSGVNMPNITDMTISFWIRCYNAQSFTDQTFLNSNSSGNHGSVVVFNGDLKLWGAVNSSASMDSEGLNDQQWHHVGIIKTGVTTRYYFDFVQSIGYTGVDQSPHDVNYVQMCRFYGTYGFTGDVANMQIYDYALGTGDMQRYAYRHIDNTKGENCKANFTLDNTFNSSINGYTGAEVGGVVYAAI